jgi:hypothetical protein
MTARPVPALGSWEDGPLSPLLRSGEVHVWDVDVDARLGDAARLEPLCALAEVRCAHDHEEPLARDRFLVRRACRALLLGGYAAGNGPGELATALAHRGGRALCGFARVSRLGIALVDRELAEGAGRALLTGCERLSLTALRREDRGLAVACALAAKEALGRARGAGPDREIVELDLLAGSFESFRGGACQTFDLDDREWSGRAFPCPGGAVGAVVHSGGPRALRTWRLGR